MKDDAFGQSLPEDDYRSGVAALGHPLRHAAGPSGPLIWTAFPATGGGGGHGGTPRQLLFGCCKHPGNRPAMVLAAALAVTVLIAYTVCGVPRRSAAEVTLGR